MSKINDKFIATIMQRHYVGENTFIYNASHAILGTIDEQTKIFIDHNGNEYFSMLQQDSMTTEVPYCYYNILEVDDLGKITDKKLPIEESINQYEYLAKGIIYLVVRIDSKNAYCFPLPIDKMCSGLETARKAIETEEKQILDLEKDCIVLEEDEEEEIQPEMTEDLTELVIKVIKGEYNLDELKDIKNQLNTIYSNIEGALDSIDLQIEATEETVPVEESKIEETIEEKYTDIPEENDFDIEDIFNKVTKTLIAQDEAARRVIAEIARKGMHHKKKKEGILLTGKTGVGKTELMRLIAKYLDRPFLKIDSTQLTVPGYTGKDIEEYLWQLYVQCGYDKEQAERAIIFFDEIDKKATGKKDDVSGERVLDVLLPFIEGTTYDACSNTKNSTKKVKIDTSNMICVFGGAYTDVYKDLYEETQMGFNGNIERKRRKAAPSDFIEKGHTKDEFIGRVAIVELKDLEFDDIKRLILESDESALKIQKQIFEKLGVKITFTDGYVNAIAQGAVDRKTGARGLNTIVDESTWEAYEEVYKKSNRGKYSEVIFDEKTVEDSSCYQLVKRKTGNNTF